MAHLQYLNKIEDYHDKLTYAKRFCYRTSKEEIYSCGRKQVCNVYHFPDGGKWYDCKETGEYGEYR